MNLAEFFEPQAIAAYWAEIQPNTQQYMGAALFPSRKKAGLDLAWLKGSRGLPVSLKPSAFDAKATFRDRIGFTKLQMEMPFFREGFEIKERDRQNLLRVQDSADPYARAIIDQIFDDSTQLIEGANVVPERMIFQLLFPVDGNAGISIATNGVDYTYSYDEKGKWKKTNYTALAAADKWDAETADPFKTFKTARDNALANTGAMLTRAIMSTATFNLLVKSKAIADRYITASGNARAYLTDNEIKSIIRDTTGVSIITYDNKFRDEDEVMHSYVPDNYVCLIPDGTLGSTWYGTTPEEADLAYSNAAADVTIVNTGVALSQIINPHPVNISLFASEIVLPSFERMDDVHVIKVA